MFQNVNEHITKTDAITGIVASSNRMTAIILEQIDEKLSNFVGAINLNTFAGEKVELLFGVNKATVDGLIQCEIEALKYPLMYAQKILTGKKTNSEKYYNSIFLLENLGMYHDNINTITNGVLFHILDIVDSSGVTIVHPKSIELEKKIHSWHLQTEKHGFCTITNISEASNRVN